ncbi:hypothetical protein BGX30_014220 [Mortierella sp. GBA39]|nr:hypothetical protein BGX30_014220 [Mortierella sp. GBA39]
MGAKSNRAKQQREARDRKKRKLDDTIDPTRSANTERQANEEACTLEMGTDENGCEDGQGVGGYLRRRTLLKCPMPRDTSATRREPFFGKTWHSEMQLRVVDSDPESEINDIQRNMVIMVDEVGRYVSARTKDGSFSKSEQENLEAVQQYLRLRIRGVKEHSAAKQIGVIRGRKVGYSHWRCPIDCCSRPF